MLTFYGVNFDPDLQVKAMLLVNTLFRQHKMFKSQFRITQKDASKIFVPRLLDGEKPHRSAFI